jgi:very-short-patch-repair endonuclease
LGVPAARPAKRDNATAAAHVWSDKHAPGAYATKVVTPAAICHFLHVNGGGDGAAAWIAGRQLGLITPLQLHLVGIGRGVIRHRLVTGSLHGLYRGVYLLGHATPLPGARELGALIAVGERAVVSHESAAWLYGLVERAPDEVAVTVVGRNCRSREGIRVHRVAALDRRDVQILDGILVTSPARALIDFAATATDDELEHAYDEARARKLVREAEVDAALARARNRAGGAALRSLANRERGDGYTRSRAERLLRKLVAEAGLPKPIFNIKVHGLEVDAYWPEHRLVLEVDGYAFHSGRRRFERDRDKDGTLVAHGLTVSRVTWEQLKHRPLRAAARIALALGIRGASGPVSADRITSITKAT